MTLYLECIVMQEICYIIYGVKIVLEMCEFTLFKCEVKI